MIRGGDERAGFEADAQPARRLLRLRAWGFWDLDLTRAACAGFLLAYQEMQAAGSPWDVLIDHTRYPPQMPEVNDDIARSVALAMTMGLRRIASILDSTVAQIQLRKVSKSSGLPVDVYSFFTSEDEAMAWLLKT